MFLKKIIFIDFDGVLFDTVKEAYVVICIAMKKFKTIKDVDFDSNHFRSFLKYRNYVGPAWNYKYVWDILDNNFSDDRKQQYLELIAEARFSDYADFENLFFSTREEIKHNDFEEWLKLNEPYKFLSLIKNKWIKNLDRFFIVTTKDKKSVRVLLRKHGVSISKNMIFDKVHFDLYNSKSRIISQIMRSQNTHKAIFIDDNINHVNSCKNIHKLSTYLAGWGYNSGRGLNSLGMTFVNSQINNLLYKN